VVEKEIRDDEFYAGSGPSPLMDIGRNQRRKPILSPQIVERGVRNAGLPIHEKEADSMSAMRKRNGEDRGEEVSVAATEIDQACGRTIGIFASDPVKPELLLAENGMKPLQIATAGKSGGIGR
jgi:hypothetical protein